MPDSKKTHDSLVGDIADLEWELFQRVNNKGGTAFCQTQYETFRIMRTSQLNTWCVEVLKSYENDLLTAMAQGRNLLSEKYARMMESTSPEEYEQLKGQLQAIPEEMQTEIEELVEINLNWERQAYFAYPAIRSSGRPRESKMDSHFTTSVETYLRGELQTYSPKTIRLLLDDTRLARDTGRNMVLENLDNIVKAYGYESLDTAEEALQIARLS